MQRTVLFVSESTGITAETLGQSLLSQFSHQLQFKRVHEPYINSVEKAHKLVEKIRELHTQEGQRPLVIATLADKRVSAILRQAPCFFLEVFDILLAPLSEELGVAPSGRSGLSHGIANDQDYERRIAVINYTMANDDGVRLDRLGEADVVLVGVSRSGKTPTCLYLAMHYGVRAANYPITAEDFERGDLPKAVLEHRERLIALTIAPERLHFIREQRRPGSRYAQLPNCQKELRLAAEMFRRYGLRVVDTSNHSIEEIASEIFKEIRN
jgi:[pyruvate, water dikinase]-phosphate phosphotransferase / [pyruvate, water dikinase] kinase